MQVVHGSKEKVNDEDYVGTSLKALQCLTMLINFWLTDTFNALGCTMISIFLIHM